MTYAIYDGNVLIADKMVSQRVGDHLIGRKPIDAKGHIRLAAAGSSVEIKYSDCKKIVFPRAGTYTGKKINCIVAAGTITNLGELIDYLNRGSDLNEYVRMEACIQPKEERRFFIPGNQLLVIMEGGEACIIENCNGGLGNRTELPLHIGSGTYWVEGLTSLFDSDKCTKLTALEAHTYASNMDKNVTMTFDYYVPSTGKLVNDQLLTDRQRSQILKRLQPRIDITIIPKEITVVN